MIWKAIKNCVPVVGPLPVIFQVIFFCDFSLRVDNNLTSFPDLRLDSRDTSRASSHGYSRAASPGSLSASSYIHNKEEAWTTKRQQE
jgi:hypothetical protein